MITFYNTLNYGSSCNISYVQTRLQCYSETGVILYWIFLFFFLSRFSLVRKFRLKKFPENKFPQISTNDCQKKNNNFVNYSLKKSLISSKKCKFRIKIAKFPNFRLTIAKIAHMSKKKKKQWENKNFV